MDYDLSILTYECSCQSSRRTHPAPVKGKGITSETAEVSDTYLSHLVPQRTNEIPRKGGENMKGINDLIWSFESETQGTPGVSINACCGGSDIGGNDNDPPPRGGPAKPPMFTEK